MSEPIEDRKFFVRQYVRTLPLNFFSVAFKAAAGASWALLDNARLLGFYALASTPSSISQRATIASSLAQALLPNVLSQRQADAVIRTAALIDLLLMIAVSIVMTLFFFATHADVVSNLGAVVFLGITAISLVEAVSGAAIHVCNARRHYVWNFFLVNSRVVVLLALLAILYVRGLQPASLGRDPSFVGVKIWLATALAAFAASCLYFWRTKVRALPSEGPFTEPSLVRNVKENILRLSAFQVSYLVFGSLPSIVLAYFGGAREVGLFSFALTLSGFLYAGLAPVNEQIFSPTFSRLVSQNDRRQLVRRIAQMQGFTLALGAVGSGVLLFVMNPLLESIHKITFLESHRFLPLLLSYQVLLMCGSAFTYPLFCMNRFKALAVIYGLPAAAAFIWVLATRQDAMTALEALPLSAAALNVLGAGYIWKLVASGAPLLRRSLVGEFVEKPA